MESSQTRRFKKVFWLALLAGWLAPRLFATGGPLPPSNLMCDLIEHTEWVFSNCYPTRLTLPDFLRNPAGLQAPVINSSRPMFGWVVNDSRQDILQTAYQIQVATRLDGLQSGVPDVWDSGEISSDDSVAVEFGGPPLEPNAVYYWRARTWNNGVESDFSTPQAFVTGAVLVPHGTSRYPLQKTDETAKDVVQVSDKIIFVDFGRDAFGRLRLTLDSPEAAVVTVCLGEVARNGRLNPAPGGSRRYLRVLVPVERGRHTYEVQLPPDERNTGPDAAKLPACAGVVMPFRYCEIVQAGEPAAVSNLTRETLHYPFDDTASAFASSNPVLNDIWNLCKYSVRATSYAGVYVDGDRERIPYEADAFINQKCQYAVDREFSLARYSEEYLINHATWPTEWILLSPQLAWNDYLFTGNLESARKFYNELKVKTLMALAEPSGLISTRAGMQNARLWAALHLKDKPIRDIVDWPQSGSAGVGKAEPGETDGFVFTNLNTVVNAYYFGALERMSQLAKALDKSQDAEFFSGRAQQVKRSFNEALFDVRRGVYVDGVGTGHASLHANMYALAFGLVPEYRQATVVDFIQSRGMACSVYGAQHLLDALYETGEANYALNLLTTNNLRSWAHMIYDVGTTITLEAWDDQFKTNEDWNHAWGAAPANIIPFDLMGVQPIEPGWKAFRIKPQPAGLTQASLTLPTIRGSIQVSFTNQPGQAFDMSVRIPANAQADVYLPVMGADCQISFDGGKVDPDNDGTWICLKGVGSGAHTFCLKRNGEPKLAFPRPALLGSSGIRAEKIE